MPHKGTTQTINGGVTGFSVSYTGDEQASLRPALQRTLPKGRFVHPIYG